MSDNDIETLVDTYTDPPCPTCQGRRLITVPDPRSTAWFPRPEITVYCPNCDRENKT